MKLKDCLKCSHYINHFIDNSDSGVMCLFYEDQIMERVLVIADNRTQDFILDCPRVTYIDEAVYH